MPFTPENPSIAALKIGAWPPMQQDEHIAYEPSWLRPVKMSSVPVRERFDAMRDHSIVMPLPDSVDPLYAAQAGLLRIVHDTMAMVLPNRRDALPRTGIMSDPVVCARLADDIDRTVWYTHGPIRTELEHYDDLDSIVRLTRRVVYAAPHPSGRQLLAFEGSSLMDPSASPVTLPERLAVNQPTLTHRPGYPLRIRERLAGVTLLLPEFKAA